MNNDPQKSLANAAGSMKLEITSVASWLGKQQLARCKHLP